MSLGNLMHLMHFQWPLNEGGGGGRLINHQFCLKTTLGVSVSLLRKQVTGLWVVGVSVTTV